MVDTDKGYICLLSDIEKPYKGKYQLREVDRQLQEALKIFEKHYGV